MTKKQIDRLGAEARYSRAVEKFLVAIVQLEFDMRGAYGDQHGLGPVVPLPPQREAYLAELRREALLRLQYGPWPGGVGPTTKRSTTKAKPKGAPR
jgi:hypothetical protein